jgi:acetyl-CoA C-acetyltransferase
MRENLPVIIGAGQVCHRPGGPDDLTTPLELMAEAARLAAGGASMKMKIWERLDSVRVINVLSWSYPRPPLVLADTLGAPTPRVSVYTTVGGDSPQWQVNQAATAIQSGAEGLTLIAGAEALESARVAARDSVRLSRGDRGEVGEMVGESRPGVGPAELALQLGAPAFLYPVFENALRARYGRDREEHRRVIAEMLSRFSLVAKQHPAAWFRSYRTPEEIAQPSPDNRMVGYPYTKLMNAIIRVDQGAALLLAPASLATELGVPEERWVYVWSGAEARDVWYPFERPELSESPGIEAACSAALDGAGIGMDEVSMMDLYSCFPSAVEMACDALHTDLDDPRGLTVTGGLAAFGGAGNNYSTHAIATMADQVRARPGEVGLVTALGWYITKHAAGVYAADPPPTGEFRRGDTRRAQEGIDAAALTPPLLDAEGTCTVESYTVLCGRDGEPFATPVVCRLDDGRRAVALASSDFDTYQQREVVGERGRLIRGSSVSAYEPVGAA